METDTDSLCSFAEKRIKKALGGNRKDWSGSILHPLPERQCGPGLGAADVREEVKMARFWIHFEGSVEVN